MGNAFGTVDGAERLHLSNGGTDVLFDVLTLAGCALADTPWRQNLTLLFADGHRLDRGFSGFDLAELPWTNDARREQVFFRAIVSIARGRHGWHRLNYDPPYIAGQLATYAAMLRGFTPRPNPDSRYGDWAVPPDPAGLEPCARHGIYVGELGCRLCDTWIQPQ
jgi:hypothetical protein